MSCSEPDGDGYNLTLRVCSYNRASCKNTARSLVRPNLFVKRIPADPAPPPIDKPLPLE